MATRVFCFDAANADALADCVPGGCHEARCAPGVAGMVRSGDGWRPFMAGRAARQYLALYEQARLSPDVAASR